MGEITPDTSAAKTAGKGAARSATPSGARRSLFPENVLERTQTEALLNSVAKPKPSMWERLLKELLPKSKPAGQAASAIQQQWAAHLLFKLKQRVQAQCAEREALQAAREDGLWKLTWEERRAARLARLAQALAEEKEAEKERLRAQTRAVAEARARAQQMWREWREADALKWRGWAAKAQKDKDKARCLPPPRHAPYTCHPP